MLGDVKLPSPGILGKMSFARGMRVSSWTAIALAAIFFALDSIVTRLPRIGVFATLHWNWQGQILRSVLALGCLVLLMRSSRGDDLRLRVEWPALGDALVAGAVVGIVSLIAVGLGNTLPSDRETIAYELTLPGIAEELAFRGVVQSLLNRGLGRPWRWANATFGPGAILTALLFLALHVVRVSASFHVSVSRSVASWIGVGITGLLLGYVRERTESLWPGILIHNLANGVILLGTSWLITS